MNLTIRKAGPDDGPAIWTILKPVFRAGETYTVDPTISEADALAYWCAVEKTVFVAQDEAVDGSGQALGTYYIRPNQAGAGDHICNCGYITAEAARGKGIARAMLEHSLEVARASGYLAMQYNFVVSTNTRAVETWTRAGFRTVGRLPRAFRHPEDGMVDALVMWKDLGEAAP